ncbi:transcriptional regulator, partial [Solicola sp. PLA-1-18]|uniref:transcriptional regulator n=1 Tax=Solicola sp. PLA-1-18 TaxID=3380532 RepID=UPI003B76247D
LVVVDARGRQRFFRLADASVAEALEQLGRLCPTTEVASLRRSREQRDLARARLCYDHLAGRLGVGVAEAWVASGWLVGPDLDLTDRGAVAIVDWGLDVPALARGRRPLTRACPDWTERRPHLAGALGAALARGLVERGWVRRRRGGRGLDVTPLGEDGLRESWGVEPA